MQSQRQRHSPDYLIISSMALLMVLGLIIIYSISPVLSHKILGDVSDNHFLYGQLTHVGVGLAVFLFCSNFHYSKWQKYIPALLVAASFTAMLLLIPGLSVSKNGATRWVALGPLSFQPSEILKFVMVIFLAQAFSGVVKNFSEHKSRLKIAIAAFLVSGIFVMFLQRDMGTMLVIASILFGTYFLSGAPLKHVGSFALVGIGSGVASVVMFPHRIARFLTFLDPSADVGSSGYHLNQALIAIGSGGFLGLGIGKSIQVYGYLPEAANDSIFAIVGETFGFVGALLILGLFGVLVYRCIKIGVMAPNRFSQLMVFGVALWLGSQTIINITAMLGLVPLTGIPLPFLSYGGTSLVASAAAIGIVVNVSKYTNRGLYAQNRTGRGRDRRPYNAYSQLRPSPK